MTKQKIVSDIPFNKIVEMITRITKAKSPARIGLLRELWNINSTLRLIEEEKRDNV